MISRHVCSVFEVRMSPIAASIWLRASGSAAKDTQSRNFALEQFHASPGSADRRARGPSLCDKTRPSFSRDLDGRTVDDDGAAPGRSGRAGSAR